jgi:hypothetical protein
LLAGLHPRLGLGKSPGFGFGTAAANPFAKPEDEKPGIVFGSGSFGQPSGSCVPAPHEILKVPASQPPSALIAFLTQNTQYGMDVATEAYSFICTIHDCWAVIVTNLQTRCKRADFLVRSEIAVEIAKALIAFSKVKPVDCFEFQGISVLFCGGCAREYICQSGPRV